MYRVIDFNILTIIHSQNNSIIFQRSKSFFKKLQDSKGINLISSQCFIYDIICGFGENQQICGDFLQKFQNLNPPIKTLFLEPLHIIYFILISYCNLSSLMTSIDNQNSLQDQRFNFGPWNEEETLKYLVFLDENKIIMASKLKKKKFRVFDQMSLFVKTRSSLQCRSHHQKASQKYKEIKSIILHQKQELKSVDYKMMFKQMRDDAKVKQDYQNKLSTNQTQENIYEIQKKELPTNSTNQVISHPVIPNYFHPMNNSLQMMTPQFLNYFPMGQTFYYPNICVFPQFQGI